MATTRNGKHLSKEKANAICRLVEKGLPYTTAAQKLGIAPHTVCGWRKDGTKIINSGAAPSNPREKLLVYFCEQINAALASYMERHLENIEKGAQVDPRHSEWLLTKTFPDIYGDRSTLNLETKNPMKDTINKFLGDLADVPDGDE